MNISRLLITTFGVFIIGFIYWFFFGKKENEAVVEGILDVKVKGGYSPETIKLKKGVKSTLVFYRTDSNSCLEDFILPDFKIKKYLPLNKKVKVVINPDKTGVFGFHCGMNMYHGKIVVEN